MAKLYDVAALGPEASARLKRLISLRSRADTSGTPERALAVCSSKSCASSSSSSARSARPRRGRILQATSSGTMAEGQARHTRLKAPVHTLQLCTPYYSSTPCSGGGGSDGSRRRKTVNLNRVPSDRRSLQPEKCNKLQQSSWKSKKRSEAEHFARSDGTPAEMRQASERSRLHPLLF